MPKGAHFQGETFGYILYHFLKDTRNFDRIQRIWLEWKHANCQFNWLGKASQIKHLLSDGKLSERALRFKIRGAFWKVWWPWKRPVGFNVVGSLTKEVYFLAAAFLVAGFLAAGFLAAGFLAAGFLDLAFWIWTCLIRPSSELLDSLQPEVRALGVICHFSSNYRRPLNADDLKAKQFLATWPSFVLMCLISLNWPLFSKHPFVSHQWNLGQTAMMSWATFSECEKVSEPHCEFRNFDASPPPPKKKGGEVCQQTIMMKLFTKRLP